MKKNVLIAILLLLFASCSKHLSEVSIFSNLQEGDSISVAFCSRINGPYITGSSKIINSDDIIQNRIDILFPDSLNKKIIAISFEFHCYSDTMLSISSVRLNGYGTAYPQDIMNYLWWQYGLMFEIDSEDNTIKSQINKNIPGTFSIRVPAFYKSFHLISLQLFLRLFFLATLLLFIFILYKQSPTQRLPLFAIALFLSSLFLKTNYSNYAVVVMSLSMITAFLYNKSRRFMWQPIFYVICAIYLMNIIGLAYTGDFKLGMKRLDTSIVFILFPVVFSMIQVPKKNVVLLLRFFVWSVSVFCAFGLLSYATIMPEFTWDIILKDSKLYAPLLMMWPAHPHPSYLSVILLMVVPVALYLRYHDEKQITMVEMLLGVLLPIVFTVMSGARVGMMIAPALLVLGYLFHCKFKPMLKWGFVLAGIAVMGVMFHLFPKAVVLFVDPIRVDLRKTAISAIKEKPVFGWGTGYVTPLIQSEERAQSLRIETPYLFNQFHNQYLEDMVQFGIMGILILLVLFGWMLWVGVRERNYLVLSLLVIYTLFCWTETVFFVAKGVIPFTFWFCFLMSNRNKLTQMNADDADNTDFA